MQKINFLNILLGSLQAINGLSALLGGYMLITDPTGQSLGLKMEWLQNTPFTNYLLPGIVLFLLIGVTNVWGIWLIFHRKEKRAAFETVFGLILMGWIIAQVIWIGYKGSCNRCTSPQACYRPLLDWLLATQMKRA